jgi:hypothetical protein
MRKYFHIFLGAVFIRNGLSAIQEWISALIDWSSASTTNHVTLNGDNVTNSDTAAVDVSFSKYPSPFKMIYVRLGQCGKSRLTAGRSRISWGPPPPGGVCILFHVDDHSHACAPSRSSSFHSDFGT